MTGAEAYQWLESRFARASSLEDAAAVLQWDQATFMPSGGAEARGRQIATLSVLAHEVLVDPALADALDAAEAAPPDEDWARANLREMRRLWRHSVALPERLVEALAQARSRCELVWREARERDDFAALVPSLDALLVLVRESAVIRGDALGISPYDALLDAHDPGLRDAAVEALFAELRGFLPELLGRVIERQAAAPAPPAPGGPFPAEHQHALGLRMMEALGFDFHHGRLDTSHHPFTGGVPDDVRITTRWDADDFTSGLMAVLHETGHALYERGLPERWRGQPVGRSRGMTLHESQSLLVEMQACRSDGFIEFVATCARETFGDGARVPAFAGLRRLYRRVARSLIRVDADEVSYPLHVILRHELERALVAGELAVADLPGAWNEGMERQLGIRPPDDREGCLQDVHWPAGAFGYFPTYTLGALVAAQLFAAASAARPGVPEDLRRGDFGALRGWLREHVHGQGCRFEPAELVERASGEPLGTRAFREHLERRYLEEPV